jgi:hypothetical protein
MFWFYDLSLLFVTFFFVYFQVASLYPFFLGHLSLFIRLFGFLFCTTEKGTNQCEL